MARLLLKLAIFAVLWVVGSFLFSSTVGGEGSVLGNALFVGETILGSELASEANEVVGLLLSFIVTAAIYYFVAEILALILVKAFGGGK